jgi:hypothetical protein
MTRLSLATATTSGVIVGNSLIWTTRSICAKSRSTSRKLPRVPRAIAVTTSSPVLPVASRPKPELVRVPLNHRLQFLPAQRPEVMHEADARVELRVSRQPFL